MGAVEVVGEHGQVFGGPEQQLGIALLLERLHLSQVTRRVRETWNRRSIAGSCPEMSSLGAVCPQTGFVWGRTTMEYVVV